ncbi:MAG: hypothetical protein QF384_02625, partial [Alphaproteobacteria bacterium]|nr:hypothetical protein [Alphaproteobacteria bacterium]
TYTGRRAGCDQRTQQPATQRRQGLKDVSLKGVSLEDVEIEYQRDDHDVDGHSDEYNDVRDAFSGK